MDKGIADAENKSNAIDQILWREFQEGLAALLRMPISLFDSSGKELSPSGCDDSVCAAVKATAKGCELCRNTYLEAAGQVTEKGRPYIYKCHINKYIFAIPVYLDAGRTVVVAGGRVYLQGRELKELYEGLSPFGFDERTVARFSESMLTVPPRSIFSIPTIVNNIAAPFLKSLSSGASRRGRPEDAALAGGLHALDQVYRSLAPVLDREELYETILEKSFELVGAEKGSLMILDNKTNMLSVKAAKGIDRDIIDNLKVKVGEGISGAIAAKGLPVIVKNVEAEVPSWRNRPTYRTKSFVSIPLKLDTRVIGVINLSDKITGEVFSEDDLQLLLSFANYASIAIERGAYYSMSEELKTLSMTDPLTGLFNRRYFRERLFEEVERVKRHCQSFSTFIIDIDNFKGFNDRYGHLAGDEILKGVAHIIRDAVRSMDVVARYGGEEFAALLPHTNKKDAAIIAERIRKEVEEYAPKGGLLEEWPTISLGVAEFPTDATNIDELIHRADSAMYHAKRTGKNRVVFYER